MITSYLTDEQMIVLLLNKWFESPNEIISCISFKILISHGKILFRFKWMQSKSKLSQKYADKLHIEYKQLIQTGT